MNIQSSLEKLNTLLPLKERQDQLPTMLKNMHQRILTTLVQLGRAPNISELARVTREDNVGKSLQRLNSDDLIVLDNKGNFPVGAYPVTVENTPYSIKVNGNLIYAMCALDALSVAPLFDVDVVIDSTCHVSQTPIRIHMQGSNILEAQPSMEIMVGIHWQQPSDTAANSLCLEMVFLKDRKTADTWQGNNTSNISLYTLSEAVDFGSAFFSPILDDK